ncbi:unnamed protein product [Amoebophrya sp. A120]|nr:unnamed protein product [Amoebophrya sp. A120]|eukprot:GSA120T00002130001.1
MSPLPLRPRLQLVTRRIVLCALLQQVQLCHPVIGLRVEADLCTTNARESFSCYRLDRGPLLDRRLLAGELAAAKACGLCEERNVPGDIRSLPDLPLLGTPRPPGRQRERGSASGSSILPTGTGNGDDEEGKRSTAPARGSAVDSAPKRAKNPDIQHDVTDSVTPGSATAQPHEASAVDTGRRLHAEGSVPSNTVHRGQRVHVVPTQYRRYPSVEVLDSSEQNPGSTFAPASQGLGSPRVRQQVLVTKGSIPLSHEQRGLVASPVRRVSAVAQPRIGGIQITSTGIIHPTVTRIYSPSVRRSITGASAVGTTEQPHAKLSGVDHGATRKQEGGTGSLLAANAGSYEEKLLHALHAAPPHGHEVSSPVLVARSPRRRQHDKSNLPVPHVRITPAAVPVPVEQISSAASSLVAHVQAAPVSFSAPLGGNCVARPSRTSIASGCSSPRAALGPRRGMLSWPVAGANNSGSASVAPPTIVQSALGAIRAPEPSPAPFVNRILAPTAPPPQQGYFSSSQQNLQRNLQAPASQIQSLNHLQPNGVQISASQVLTQRQPTALHPTTAAGPASPLLSYRA